MHDNLDTEIVGMCYSCPLEEGECICSARHVRMAQRTVLDKAILPLSLPKPKLMSGGGTLTKTDPRQIEHSPLFASADGWSLARLCNCWCRVLLRLN